MKKIYQNPVTEIIQIKTAQMIATSVILFGDSYGTAAGAESRQYRGGSSSVWDDEEEYEDY